MQVIVTLFIIAMAPGFAARIETRIYETLEECIGAAAVAMVRARSIENADRTYEIGCQITIPPMKDAANGG